MKNSLVLMLILAPVFSFAISNNPGVLKIKCSVADPEQKDTMSTFPFSGFEGTLTVTVGALTEVKNLLAREANSVITNANLKTVANKVNPNSETWSLSNMTGTIETTVGKLDRGEVDTVSISGSDQSSVHAVLNINLGMRDPNSQLRLNRQKIYFSNCVREN